MTEVGILGFEDVDLKMRIVGEDMRKMTVKIMQYDNCIDYLSTQPPPIYDKNHMCGETKQHQRTFEVNKLIY